MTAPSNDAVGRLLEVSHATVSRYKSGDRFPELDVLYRISTLFEWSIDDQYRARMNGTYADEFSKRVADHPALGAVVKDAAPDQ